MFDTILCDYRVNNNVRTSASIGSVQFLHQRIMTYLFNTVLCTKKNNQGPALCTLQCHCVLYFQSDQHHAASIAFAAESNFPSSIFYKNIENFQTLTYNKQTKFQAVAGLIWVSLTSTWFRVRFLTYEGIYHQLYSLQQCKFQYIKILHGLVFNLIWAQGCNRGS